MVQTRSMKRARETTVSATPQRKVRATAVVAREPYELRPRLKATIVVTIPQTPYNLRPRVHVA